MTRPLLVFDLDGTLVDTAPDLVASLNHSLASAGVEPAERDSIGFHVGMGGRAMIERAYNLRSRTLGADELERLAAIFLAHYTDNIPGSSKPYPGVVESIERHRAAGFGFAICTNKPEALALRLVETLGLARHFSAVCGADTFPFRKPDARHLLETIARAGGSPDASVMIGDSKTDIHTAQNAGVPVVAVDFGYTDRHVSEYEPSVVISAYDELTVALSGRLIAASGGRVARPA
ncbi:MAG: phosphoglycolate phosphatase [Methylobacterium mesophilicum]|nr:phosphoglycolate phosphatase [Methylobacterium mesophilicum]